MISTGRWRIPGTFSGKLFGLGVFFWASVACGEVPLQEDPLRDWKLTLPVDNNQDGKADEVTSLAGYENIPWFRRTPQGIVFRAPAGGARTSDATAFARSELREMAAPRTPAAWDCLAATRRMDIRQSLQHTTTAKPEVAIGQIHDARNDNLLIKYVGPSDANGEQDTGRIEVYVNNAAQHELLDAAYALGQTMQITVHAKHGRLEVDYRNLQSGVERTVVAQLDAASIAGACYFKAGLYIQACSRMDMAGKPNPVCLKKAWPERRYDAPEAWAELLISDLVLH